MKIHVIKIISLLLIINLINFTNFTNFSAADTIESSAVTPVLIFSRPHHGAANVKSVQQIYLKFSAPIDYSSINQQSITVLENQQNLNYYVIPDSTNQSDSLFLRFHQPLNENATVRLIISSALQTSDDRSFLPTETVFRTSGQHYLEIIATEISPQTGRFYIDFNYQVDTDSLKNSIIAVGPGDRDLFKFEYHQPTRQLQLFWLETPPAPGDYAVLISRTLKSISGHPLKESGLIKFSIY